MTFGAGWKEPACTHTCAAASAFGLAGRKCLHIVCGQRLAADTPVATLDLVDHHERHLTHVLAFDRYHRVSELADHLLLLCRRENVFDQSNVDERHLRAPFGNSSCLVDPARTATHKRVPN